MPTPNHMKHWYNCWLFHSWGPWSEVIHGRAKPIWSTEWSGWEYQRRTCKVCNRVGTRDVN